MDKITNGLINVSEFQVIDVQYIYSFVGLGGLGITCSP